MTPDEQAVSERAEAALKTNAEAYRLAQEALDMRRENERLRALLLEFIRAYANVDGLDRDGTEVKLFTAWIRGCAALGIKAEGHPQANTRR